MKLGEVEPGDVYTDSSGNWLVIDVDILKVGNGEVRLKLAKGRTDPGSWGEWLPPDREVDIHRPIKGI